MRKKEVKPKTTKYFLKREGKSNLEVSKFTLPWQDYVLFCYEQTQGPNSIIKQYVKFFFLCLSF
jgi:hypothetical protein